MPTYEYACRDCGQHVEVVQSFRDAALTTCGTCGGRLRKVFGAAGIIFKGSGYYVNDSRTKAPAKVGGGKDSEATSPAGESPGDKSPADKSAKDPGADTSAAKDSRADKSAKKTAEGAGAAKSA